MPCLCSCSKLRSPVLLTGVIFKPNSSGVRGLEIRENRKKRSVGKYFMSILSQLACLRWKWSVNMNYQSCDRLKNSGGESLLKWTKNLVTVKPHDGDRLFLSDAILLWNSLEQHRNIIEDRGRQSVFSSTPSEWCQISSYSPAVRARRWAPPVWCHKSAVIGIQPLEASPYLNWGITA